MPLIFIFVAILFWVTVATVVAAVWAVRMLFHLFAAPVYGARGLIYRSSRPAHR